MVARIPTGASRSSSTEGILKVLSEIIPLSIERYKLAKYLEMKFAIEIIYIYIYIYIYMTSYSSLV
jgi:hypothetical protein